MSKTVSKRLKIGTGLFLGIVCGVLMRSAFSKPEKQGAALQIATPTLAQNSWTPQQTASQSLAATEPQQKPAAPEMATETTKPDATTDAGPAAPDGKEEIPTDGKETLPGEGKESLPPVGQFLPNSRPGAVDPNNGDPGLEYLNAKNKNKNNDPGNRLLSPANPENIAGPVVSPETR